MKRWKLVLSYAFILIFIFVFARTLSMLNQYFGSAKAEVKFFEVVAKRTYYIPIPVSVLYLKANDGALSKIEVLPEFSKKTKVGDSIEVAISHGFLGKDWLQDRIFYESLKENRVSVGFIYLIAFMFLCFICHKQFCNLGYSKRAAFFPLLSVVFFAYILFLYVYF